jgi:hypothetical protein
MPPPAETPTAVGLASIQAMFVQTARRAVRHNGDLTLHGLCPSTLYFSDRPQRVVGHIHTRQFADLWDVGDNSFAADPPNAVLSFIEPAEEPAVYVPADVVVILRYPRLGDTRITYAVQVLDGDLPAVAGGCALFIDPFGGALRDPVSVAGVHRRGRRRLAGRR